MKQHILVVSQYFYPEEFRINDICKEWVKRGYEVTVVTGIPNYPQGKYYKDYGLWKNRKEEYEGVHIIRIPLIPRGKNALMLMLNYLSFVVSGFFWKLFTKVKADKVFIFEVSPMTQALVGVWYAKKQKIPCYIYVQDLWPENVEIVTGIHNRTIIGMIDRMVNYIYQNCNKIFATSPSFVKRIEERKSAWEGENSKVVYWPQYAEECYRPVQKQKLADVEEEDSFKIIFTGNIGYAQGLDILPRVAETLKALQAEKASQKKVVFYIIGDGRFRPELEHIIQEKGVADMFRMPGRKKPEEIPAYMAHCDVAFLSFANNPLFSMTIPAKLQSYMACGMPILAVADGETRRVIEEAGCGVCFSFGEVEKIAQYIVDIVGNKTLIEGMGNKAINYNKSHFTKEDLLNRMEEYLGNC